MEVVKHENIASVAVADLRVSVDELELYEAALNHLLDTLPPEEIERRFGATQDEVEGMRDDLRQARIECKESKSETVLT
jgi:hypothetical protein